MCTITLFTFPNGDEGESMECDYVECEDIESQSNYLRKYYWGEKTLWSDGYFASTIGNVSKEIAEAYIRNQG